MPAGRYYFCLKKGISGEHRKAHSSRSTVLQYAACNTHLISQKKKKSSALFTLQYTAEVTILFRSFLLSYEHNDQQYYKLSREHRSVCTILLHYFSYPLSDLFRYFFISMQNCCLKKEKQKTNSNRNVSSFLVCHIILS